MIARGGKLKRLILQMIQAHSPAVAGGESISVRKAGRVFIIDLPPTLKAKLAALADPAYTYGAAESVNLGPPATPAVPPLRPPPTLGP